MRLGQLARKLAIRPSQIVDYLSTQQIYLEEGSNAKLNDEHVNRIVQQFAPDRLKEIAADINTEEVESIGTASLIISEPSPDRQDPKVEKVEGERDTKLERPEVIKAPKVELSGLKVLGKIELPVTKKKEKPAVDPVAEETKAETQEQRRPKPETRKQVSTKSNREGTQQSWRNPIALQREREAREAEERRKAAAEREKDRRKEHYLKRVKVGQPTKPARIIDEPVELHITHNPDIKPHGLWGRFIKWLNG